MRVPAAAVSALGVCGLVHLGVIGVIGATIGWKTGAALGVAMGAAGALMVWRVRERRDGRADADRC